MGNGDQNDKTEHGWLLRPIGGPTECSKAEMLGPTEEQLLTELYNDYSRWLEDMKAVCKRAGMPLEQHLRKALGLAIKAGRVRDCSYETGLRLRGPKRAGQDILLFFTKKCPHARDAFLRGALPPYPWGTGEIVQPVESGARVEESAKPKQKARADKPEKESWLWKLYERTLKVIIDAVLDRMWPR